MGYRVYPVALFYFLIISSRYYPTFEDHIERTPSADVRKSDILGREKWNDNRQRRYKAIMNAKLDKLGPSGVAAKELLFHFKWGKFTGYVQDWPY
jgi:hypothetical protein